MEMEKIKAAYMAYVGKREGKKQKEIPPEAVQLTPKKDDK